MTQVDHIKVKVSEMQKVVVSPNATVSLEAVA